MKWYDMEIVGLEALDKLVADTLTREDLLSVLTTQGNEEYTKTADGYQLKIYLPGAKKEELLLHESGSDIVLRIGNFKRSIPLPNVLRKYQISGAKVSGDFLNIMFTPMEGGIADE